MYVFQRYCIDFKSLFIVSWSQKAPNPMHLDGLDEMLSLSLSWYLSGHEYLKLATPDKAH